MKAGVLSMDCILEDKEKERVACEMDGEMLHWKRLFLGLGGSKGGKKSIRKYSDRQTLQNMGQTLDEHISNTSPLACDYVTEFEFRGYTYKVVAQSVRLFHIFMSLVIYLFLVSKF